MDHVDDDADDGFVPVAASHTRIDQPKGDGGDAPLKCRRRPLKLTGQTRRGQGPTGRLVSCAVHSREFIDVSCASIIIKRNASFQPAVYVAGAGRSFQKGPQEGAAQASFNINLLTHSKSRVRRLVKESALGRTHERSVRKTRKRERRSAP